MIAQYLDHIVLSRTVGGGMCGDPGKRDATLGAGGPGPPGGGGEQQLVPDSGGEET